MAAVRFARLVYFVPFLKEVQSFQVARQKEALTKSDTGTDGELLCLGSMCGKRYPVVLSEGKRQTPSTAAIEYELRGRHPYCAPDRSSASRLLLMPLVAQHHGSTALASVLMSSSEIATLCSANTWQCEGHGIGTNTGVSESQGWLETFSRHWNLKKHVFLAPYPDLKKEMSAFEDELQDGPPRAMKNVGIKRVFILHLIMWRPVCLSVLSGSAYNETVDYAREELRIMEDQVEAHKQMRATNQPVFVLSLADILWSPAWSKSRMEKMIPCIGKLDFDAVPELHYDHFPRNNFKFDMSVQQFGEANSPSQCDYNVQKRACGDTHDVFSWLPEQEQKRARAAAQYLDEWSQ